MSHGATGYGGYASSGAAMPAAPTGDERTNATTLGPFRAKVASESAIGPDDTAHFDDLLGYRTLRDLTRLAGRQERIWLP